MAHPEHDSQKLDTSQYLAGWRLHVVIACLFFGSFLIALDTNIINVAIPHISSEFRALNDVAWYGSAYLLTITAFQPIYGSMYKYFPTDIVYRVSISIFERAANLPTLAQTPKQLVVLQDIWNSAVVRTIIMTTAVVGAAVPFTLGMEWLNAVKVAEKRKNATIEAAVSEKANGDDKIGKASGDSGAPPEHGDAGQVA
ncbi:hypothetical protein PG997_000040 [Apiospora hydei]|uniref:Uncharacterized protein n=1 Tax=Apiospora hydei TaxID=1337664 RepID=A0ABR1X9L3_9PEZI